MSNKNPMKFLPPDDPTAVYPIRTSNESDGEPLEPDPDSSDSTDPEGGTNGEPASAGADEDPLPKTFEFADDTTAPKATPLPSSSPAAPAEVGGLNPLLLIAFLGGGIILASLVLLALAAVLFFLQ